MRKRQGEAAGEREVVCGERRAEIAKEIPSQEREVFYLRSGSEDAQVGISRNSR